MHSILSSFLKRSDASIFRMHSSSLYFLKQIKSQILSVSLEVPPASRESPQVISLQLSFLSLLESGLLLQWGFSSNALDSVTNYLTVNRLGEEVFPLAHSLGVRSISMGSHGGYISSAVRKERATGLVLSSLLPVLIQPLPDSRE